MKGKSKGRLTWVREAREKALQAGLELIATCFIERADCAAATGQEVAFLVWERKSAENRGLPGLKVNLEKSERLQLRTEAAEADRAG